MEQYERLELLGHGRMSAVWLARNTSTQELVALKIMVAIAEDDKRDQKARERFYREIEIARSLQHPHILPILDYGHMHYKGNSVPFLVTPYIPDGSIVDLAEKFPPWINWTLAQTVDVIAQAAESLWYLHTRTPQIVHQDVKPGNFLVQHLTEKEGSSIHVYLCDFGISRWRRSSPALTMASEVLGTFAFMAPEQVERRVDCASDQYALAVMACFIMTGKLPIQAETNEQYAEAHLNELPTPPSQLLPQRNGLASFDSVILRAMEKDPTKRYPTILDFARALQNTTLPQDRVLHTMTTVHPEKEPVKIGAIAPSGDQPIAPLPWSDANQERPIAIDPLENSDIGTLDEPLPTRMPMHLLDMRRPEFEFAPLNWRTVMHRNLTFRPKHLSWLSNGEVLACVLYGNRPLLLGRDGTIQEVQTANAFSALSLCWLPITERGIYLAITSSGEIRFWSADAQREMPLTLQMPVRHTDGLDWSRNSQLALWVENQVVIYTLPPELLRARQAPTPHILATGDMRSGNIGVLRWSPDGLRLAAGASNGQIVCWEMGRSPSFHTSWLVVGPGKKVNSLAWSPDGTLLVAAFRDNRVVGWDIHSRREAFVWSGLSAMPRVLSIGRDSCLLLASTEKRLLLGYPDDPFPQLTTPGQLIASWSPVNPEFATLDEQRESVLVIWSK